MVHHDSARFSTSTSSVCHVYKVCVDRPPQGTSKLLAESMKIYTHGANFLNFGYHLRCFAV